MKNPCKFKQERRDTCVKGDTHRRLLPLARPCPGRRRNPDVQQFGLLPEILAPTRCGVHVHEQRGGQAQRSRVPAPRPLIDTGYLPCSHAAPVQADVAAHGEHDEEPADKEADREEGEDEGRPPGAEEGAAVAAAVGGGGGRRGRG